jgi:porphobilinogen synthase
MLQRPRRNRSSPGIRSLVRETELSPGHLVLPVFIQEGEDRADPISAMPGCNRLTLDRAVLLAREAMALGVAALALFPAVAESLKDDAASEAANPDGLVPRAVRHLKREVPGVVIITDVALDPYSSDGHDGLVREGRIDNDATLPVLARMALVQARAGADVVAPSDMMDGRVQAIREALDREGFSGVGICSYCAKYASAFYGPFRAALDSAPRHRPGVPEDKRTYQMDPANVREALREAAADEAEGADWLMVKPGLPYLDVIRSLRQATALPVAAYHVSGEYSMLRAAAERGWLEYGPCLLESLTSLRRAGADIIFTYGALDAARLLAARG